MSSGQALKGRNKIVHRLSRPFRAVPLVRVNPGRCPGLACLGPLAHAHEKCMTRSKGHAVAWRKTFKTGGGVDRTDCVMTGSAKAVRDRHGMSSDVERF